MADAPRTREQEHPRPFRLAPFGAHIRRKKTKDIGPVVAYVTWHDGSFEYVAKVGGTLTFVPLLEAVPVKGTAGQEEKGVRGPHVTIAAAAKEQAG